MSARHFLVRPFKRNGTKHVFSLYTAVPVTISWCGRKGHAVGKSKVYRAHDAQRETTCGACRARLEWVVRKEAEAS
jgi:hypothetical protein